MERTSLIMLTLMALLIPLSLTLPYFPHSFYLHFLLRYSFLLMIHPLLSFAIQLSAVSG